MYSGILKSADGYFSKFIRLRHAVNGYATCFTCGHVSEYQYLDCGHFITRKNHALRFDEINCQVQCKRCNQFLRGDLEVFEQRLVEVYGMDAVSKLLSKKYTINKRKTIHELKEIIKYYKGT